MSMGGSPRRSAYNGEYSGDLGSRCSAMMCLRRTKSSLRVGELLPQKDISKPHNHSVSWGMLHGRQRSREISERRPQDLAGLRQRSDIPYSCFGEREVRISQGEHSHQGHISTSAVALSNEKHSSRDVIRPRIFEKHRTLWKGYT